MKTFISLSIDEDNSNETGVVVFQAKTEEDAVLAVAEHTLGEDEIQDFIDNGESGDGVADFVPMYILDEWPVMLVEIKKMADYNNAKNLEPGFWYANDVLPLLEKKYPNKK